MEDLLKDVLQSFESDEEQRENVLKLKMIQKIFMNIAKFK